MLEPFLLISGLKVNFSKSLLFGCNVALEEVARKAECIDFRVGSLPIMYLGAPLGENSRRRTFWKSVIDKVKRKLNMWNSKYLSLSGR